MSGRARRLAPAAVLVAVVAALLLPWPREIMLTAFQRRFLYFPIRDFIAAPADYGFEREDVQLRTEDGLSIHAWWLPAPGAERTVLFLHGNAGNVSYWVEAATVFREVGWNTLLLDYRGYGRSEGEPTEEGTYLDAKAAWRHLSVDRGIDPSRILVVGRSLGGGVATWLAEHHPVAGLVLEATFTSIADVVATVMPVPGLRSFVRLGYPSLERMPRLSAPLLVVHGRGDELVPFSHGQALFNAAGGPKHFVELRGGHNDAFAVSRGEYVAALRGFEGRFGRE
ncbi:MAG: alpha/beta hydrolase [Candidatus Binatia bacterium]